MRERKLSDYYVNQEVWSPLYGRGIVEVIENIGKYDNYPIKCLFGTIEASFTVSGLFSKDNKMPALFFEEFIIPESSNIPKKWTPKDGELYYTITKNRCLCVTFLRFNNSLNDENNINQDNCFKTEKEAQEKLDKILEVLKGE